MLQAVVGSLYTVKGYIIQMQVIRFAVVIMLITSLYIFLNLDCLATIEKEFIFHLLENNVAVWLMNTNSPFQHTHIVPDKLDKVPNHPVPSHLKVVYSYKKHSYVYLHIRKYR